MGTGSKQSKELHDEILERKKQNVERIHEPHYYGKIDGVHVFHGDHPYSRSMFGSHVETDKQDAMEEIAKAKKSGLPVILHGNPPPELRDKAPPASHPHNYDWHDGHTKHYGPEDLDKYRELKEPEYGDEDQAIKNSDTYKHIAKQFGQLGQKKSNLQFYRGIEDAEGAIDHLIGKNGYTTYEVGGPYGKPNHQAQNYDTGSLPIFYDKKASEQGNAGDEAYSRSWRKLHELSHALTRPEINEMYGEGKRTGALGTRTPHEAKRSLHWEWLAAHKQRDLANQLGFKISDEDFNKELNTVMSDSLHRAITGKYANASEEKFQPSSEIVPLEQGFKMVDDHAKKMGLPHENATLDGTPGARPQEMTKNDKKLEKAFTQEDGETLTDPRSHQSAAGAVPPALIAWGRRNLVSMAKDAINVIPLDGKIIKVRKVMEDLYSGWIESDGKKIHQFEKITMPELLSQIQSKLELYGREEEIVGDNIVRTPAKEMVDEHEKLVDVLESPSHEDDKVEAEKQKKELEEYKEIANRKNPNGGEVIESAEEAKEEEESLDEISNRLRELQAKIDAFKGKEKEEHKETISSQELAAGMVNPERECPACERPVEDCVCYTGLSNPRVEFDGKKVSIFFKSEWSEEDRANFVYDLKNRAGSVLSRRTADRARSVLENIRGKFKDA